MGSPLSSCPSRPRAPDQFQYIRKLHGVNKEGTLNPEERAK